MTRRLCFALAAVLALPHMAHAQTAAVRCDKNRGTDGAVVGSVHVRADSSPAAVSHGRVTAEWLAELKDSTHLHHVESAVASNGEFQLCGVPVNVALRIEGFADGTATAEPTVVKIPAATKLTHVDLEMELESDLAKRGGVFTGVVVSDSTQLPIVGAEVSFPELAKNTLTDERGAFRIAGIPAGEHHLNVRRLGFGAADAKVRFTGHERVEQRIVLGRVLMLNPVVVIDKFTERWLRDFEEARRLGLGKFLTRDELEVYTGMKFASVLAQLPGIEMLATSSQMFPHSRRSWQSVCPTGEARCLDTHGYYHKPGVPIACYSLIWVDGALITGFEYPTRPYDLNEFFPESVEAVEYYRGLGSTPMKYQRPGSDCGVIVIWRRRT